MKILYISGDSGVEVGGRKGASTHIRETCHALKRFGHEVKIVTPCPGDLSRVEVPVIKVPAPRAKWIGSDTRHLVLNHRMSSVIERLIREFQPDAIYERYSLYQMAGLKLAQKYNIPRILEVNTLLAREQADRLHFPGIAEKVERNIWRQEKALICVSQTLKNLMTKSAGLDHSKIVGFEISPVAVDTYSFHPDVKPSTEILKFKGDKKLAGYVGTLTAWHGVDLFFDAARILRERNIPIKILAVGGEGDRVERLRDRVLKDNLSEYLHFYGSIDHHYVASFLAAMDMCLIADTQDWSSPTKFFEFAAMEKPIIASRSPSVEEVFGSSGNAGLFFPRGDAEQMVCEMERVLAEPEMAVQIGKAARARVLSRYTWACNIRTIMELYEKLGARNVEIPRDACPTPPDGTASACNGSSEPPV